MERGLVWVTRATGRAAVPPIAVAFAVSRWPTVASAHGDATAGAAESAISFPFLAALGLSAALGAAFGLATVARYRPDLAVDRGHSATTRTWVTVLLVALGVVALLSAGSQRWALTVGGGLVGASGAWLARAHGVSPHEGCADAALGAVLTHRTIEGVLVAGVYASSAALGLIGLAFLTVHAVAETVAIGGLYAPVSRGWAVASVLALQIAFVAGALFGGHVAGLLPASTVTVLLAGVGGVLLVAGATEFRGAAIRRHDRRGA